LKVVLLTFDIEEFDIPQEFGATLPQATQMSVTVEGTWPLLSLLKKHGIRATFFCTANFAQNNVELIQKIAKNHEIASHSFYHDARIPTDKDALVHSKKVLEDITQQSVVGFRMPRLKPFDIGGLATYGYSYDASINPTYLPNRYNFFFKKAEPYWIGNILEIPSATVPLVRIPLFWLAFKNLPLWLYKWLCGLTLLGRSTVSLYFHPWEFADISSYTLPDYIKGTSGAALTQKFDALLCYLKKKNVSFLTCQELMAMKQNQSIHK